MSAIKSFFDKTFFLNGTEGVILFAVCIAAVVCTVIVIALAVTVIVAVKRRKRGNVSQISEPAQEAETEPAEETADITEEPTAQETATAETAETLDVTAENAEPDVIRQETAESAEPSVAVRETASVTEVPAEETTATDENAESRGAVKVVRSTSSFAMADYDKSFTAKLIQSSDEIKQWYSQLKNALLGFKKVTSRISWHTDSINRGRLKLAKFAIRGKTLRLYLALNPEDYVDSKYKVERAEGKRYEAVPCLYRIKNARRAKYALELIALLADRYGLQPVEREEVDYRLPYEENEPLIARGLIKEIVYNTPAEAAAAEVSEETFAETAAAAEEPEELVEEAATEPAEEPTENIADGAEETPARESAENAESRGAVKVVRSTSSFAMADYDKSFTAKLIQSSDEIKQWYSQLKNALLGYKKVTSRISWHTDSINRGRLKLAKFAIRGKTLRLYLALDSEDYVDSKYKVERAEGKRYEAVPCLYRIKNARRAKYALELIALLADRYGLQPVEREEVDYRLPYEENEPLIARGLIKEIVYAENPAPAQAEPDVEVVEEAAAAEVPEEVPEEQPEEAAEEVVPEEETHSEPAEEPSAEEPAAAQTTEEVPEEEPAEEATEPAGEVAEETEIEELSKKELKDVQSHEDEAEDEDGIEVVGVMFRRRGRKVYWFDPDGKEWEKGEIALYKSPDNPPQEVIVVDNAKISPTKLHLPLKPLCKVHRRPQAEAIPQAEVASQTVKKRALNKRKTKA